MSEKKELIYEKKTVYEKAGADVVNAAYDYAKGYARFLDAAKTEREAVTECVRMAEEAGFRPYNFGDALKAGNFVDKDGNVLGTHDGIVKYTVGQRKGLGIALGKRMFVTKIDPDTNTVTLSDIPPFGFVAFEVK